MKWLPLLVLVLLAGCVSEPMSGRMDSVRGEKVLPGDDPHPPVLERDMWEEPEPLPYPINTAGAEDSPFITPDGGTLYFWFTPDASAPLEQQVADRVTGVYVSHLVAGEWREPEWVDLGGKPGESLDGCFFTDGEEAWWCSARRGNYRGVDLWRADLTGGRVKNVRNAGQLLNEQFRAGEMHRVNDTLYFASDINGDYDLFVTHLVGGEWQVPGELPFNTGANENQPFVTADGKDIYFTRDDRGAPAIYTSHLDPGGWIDPRPVVSSFAGEPTLDREGNLYFVHHFWDGGMLEADIYVARPRPLDGRDQISG